MSGARGLCALALTRAALHTVIATHPNEGIIEVVPAAQVHCVGKCSLCPHRCLLFQSRDQLGKKSDGNLYQWFLTKYGAENTEAFQRARNNFIKSTAAYSLVSYILQVKGTSSRHGMGGAHCQGRPPQRQHHGG